MKNKIIEILKEEMGADRFDESFADIVAYRIEALGVMPKGYKIYKCTDCGSVNIKKDNGEIRVGFCDECEHPLWND